MSRKLVANLFYSVNGIASDPNLFQFDSFDDDLAAYMTQGIGSIDANILGRVTYQEWSGYWPSVTEGEDAGFADFINTTPKYVASRTLGSGDLAWENSHVIQDDLLDFVRSAKAGDGGDLAVQGSLSVARQCVEAGLVDELTLIIHPAIAGSGRALFDGVATTRLNLLGVRGTQKGNILATYGPRV
jgi:dihydrofolate reductase